MKHRSLQQLSLRSTYLPWHTQLRRLCLAIVLASLLLSIEVLILPSAGVHAIPIDATQVGDRSVWAGQVANATIQVPPSVVNRLRQALSQRTKIPAAKLKVVEAMPKTWANGCLGLAKADEICTQALVEGWRVVFSDGSQRWIYRTDKQARGYRLEP